MCNARVRRRSRALVCAHAELAMSARTRSTKFRNEEIAHLFFLGDPSSAFEAHRLRAGECRAGAARYSVACLKPFVRRRRLAPIKNTDIPSRSSPSSRSSSRNYVNASLPPLRTNIAHQQQPTNPNTMSRFVRDSRVRHVFCRPPKAENCYSGMRLSTSTGDGNCKVTHALPHTT